MIKFSFETKFKHLEMTAYSDSNSQDEVQLYPIRWLFLAVAALFYLLFCYSSVSISQINNIFVLYFDVTYAAVDWGSIGQFAGASFATVFVSWLTFTKRLQFRRLVITVAILMCLSLSVKMAAFADTKLFALITVGQLLGGACLALQFPMNVALIMAWFPHEEVGTALGVFLFGGSAGDVLGTLLPSHVVRQPPTNATSKSDAWRTVDRNICLLLWAVPFILYFVSMLLMIWLAADYPPKPPTLVQKQDRKRSDVRPTSDEFFSTCKQLVKNKNFFIAITGGSIIYHLNTGEYTMMTQLMTKVLRDSTHNVDVMSGYSISLLFCGAVVGSLVGGKVVNISKRYKAQAVSAAILVVLSSAAVLVSYHYNSFLGIFVGNVMLGFFARLYVLALIEILTQTTYPINESFVITIFNGFGCLMSIVVAELGRLVYNNAGGFWMLLFQTSFAILGVLFIALVTTTNKRLDAESVLRGNTRELGEESGLLDHS